MTIHSIIPIEDIFSIYQLSPQDQVQIVELNDQSRSKIGRR